MAVRQRCRDIEYTVYSQNGCFCEQQIGRDTVSKMPCAPPSRPEAEQLKNNFVLHSDEILLFCLYGLREVEGYCHKEQDKVL